MHRVGTNVTVTQIKEMDRNGLIERNLINAPIKDTAPVPDGGYTIVRFFANNPGQLILFQMLKTNLRNSFILRLLAVPLPFVFSHRSRNGLNI